jgi:thymidine kinase
MFSEKTENLIAMARSLPEEERGIYKPITDTRHEDGFIESHRGTRIPALWTDLDLLDVQEDGVSQIFVDEAQFLNESAMKQVLKLLRMGIHVTLSGLDLDYRGLPFGVMPILLSYADVVLKLTAKCSICGGASNRTHRKVQSEDLILIGGEESYDTRCLLCYPVES